MTVGNNGKSCRLSDLRIGTKMPSEKGKKHLLPTRAQKAQVSLGIIQPLFWNRDAE
jgi:hypothetical protein